MTLPYINSVWWPRKREAGRNISVYEQRYYVVYSGDSD